MADEPISGLPETTSVTGNEFIPIVQSGVTKKIKQINLVPNQASFSGTILFDSDITLSSGFIYLEKNTNSSSRILTIPSSTGNTGKFIFVAKQYNNGYNIVCSGGGISCTLTRSNDSVLYICDGSSWQPHLNISNELLLAISGKEPTITAGTTSQYWRGDKTWQTFPTISTPSLNEVTDVGNTTTNDITVGGLVVNMPSGSGVATSITKGGAGEALTVNKTSGSGNVASFTGGTTSFTDIEVTSSTASTPAFFSTVKGIISATGALLGTWFQTLTAKSTPVNADTIIVNDSASSFEAKKTTLTELWTNYIKPLFLGGGTLTGALNYAPAVTLASASTVNIGGANSNNIDISGTTTISGFDNVSDGIIRYVRFTGALTITNNATSLRLPNGSNITTQNGDTAIFRSLGAGNWICVSYKSITALSNNTVLKFDGSKLVNSNIVDTGTLLTYDSPANSSKITNHTASNQSDISLSSSNNTIRAFTYAGIQNTAITMTSSGVTIDSTIGGFVRLKSANDGRQVYVDATQNWYVNTTHQFYNQSVVRNAMIDANGLALGSATINARSQLHLQSTSKGFLPNVLTTAQRDAVSWVAGDAGMIIYNSTTNKHQGWNGTTWNDMY